MYIIIEKENTLINVSSLKAMELKDRSIRMTMERAYMTFYFASDLAAERNYKFFTNRLISKSPFVHLEDEDYQNVAIEGFRNH